MLEFNFKSALIEVKAGLKLAGLTSCNISFRSQFQTAELSANLMGHASKCRQFKHMGRRIMAK